MDIKSIKELIDADKMRDTNSYRRHPIRYVFMELNSNTQDDILTLMEGKDCDFIDLSERTKRKSDGWLTKGEVREIIDGCSIEKDTYIVGFSEWLRFCSNQVLESFVLSLCDIENKNQDSDFGMRRIYIICFSMKEYLYRVLHEKHHRFDVYDPFINGDIELSSTIKEIYFATDSVIDLIDNNVIKESQEWLKLWKNAALLDLNKPVLCYSVILQEWYDKAAPDNAFQIEVITSVPSYIEKIYDMPIIFEYQQSDVQNWLRLLEYIRLKEHKTIADVVKTVLGIKSIDPIEMCKKWIDSNDDFEKWIIANYVIKYLSYTFLSKVFSMMSGFSPKEFQKCVWDLGYAELNEEMYMERKQIIKKLSKYNSFSVPEEFIKNNIFNKFGDCASEFNVNIDDYTKFDIEIINFSDDETKNRFLSRMKFCFRSFFAEAYSGYSRVEKELIISFLGNGIIDVEEIREMYPSLYAYLGENFHSGKNYGWIDDYLREYRISKVCNSDTEKLHNMIEKYNYDEESFYKWYFSLTKQDVYVRNSDKYPVYVLDGVGAEYIPYIKYLLKKNNYKSRECEYAVCSLPSITTVNSNKITKFHKWIRDFDKNVIHDEIYSSAHNVQKSLTVLEDIIDSILTEQIDEGFIITADHGATARAKWTRPAKKYNYVNADHEGRCCIVDGKVVEKNQDYLVYDDEHQWMVALKDVSLNNNPKYEDHGGATPEEVIVPYILAIPNVGDEETIEFIITPFKISVDGLDKTVSFKITPKPERVELYEEDGRNCEIECSGELWTSQLSSGRQQTITLMVDDNKYLFDVVSNASKMIKEDDGFDD